MKRKENIKVKWYPRPPDNELKKRLVNKHLYPQITGIIDDDPTLAQKLDPNYEGFLIMFGHEKPTHTNFKIYAATDWKEVKNIMLKKTLYKISTMGATGNIIRGD